MLRYLSVIMMLFINQACFAQKTTDVMTQGRQADQTPALVLEKLQAGNLRFISGKMRIQNFQVQARKTAHSQHPMAVILSCMDSRGTPEVLFDRGLGDIFVTRTAGNVINPDILGGLEFATKLSGAKVIVILTHTDCGAIKGACYNARLGNLTELLAKIQPAVNQVASSTGKRACNNKAFIDQVAIENVVRVMKQIKEQSPVIAEMIANDKIKMVGAIQDLKTGRVRFIN